MKILVTGAAGFIGFYLSRTLAESGYDVIGLDNINEYYDPKLKFDRLKELGFSEECSKKYNKKCFSDRFKNLEFIRLNLEDREQLQAIFQEEEDISIVCNLAAQAGVRYSIENPQAYIDSNLVGFANLLECCRHNDIKHLVYASSSSVYGQNDKIPFAEEDNVDHPISLYAATKKSNELMAYTYSHLYGFKTTGLRFFTVYGPWGRPDMAMFLFTDAIIKGDPIKVFNQGNLERDFTYIDDIVAGIQKVIGGNGAASKISTIYNIGNSKPVKLMDFIDEIEKNLGIEAKKNFMEMQPGDVQRTWANVDALKKDFDYNPSTPITAGVSNFITWYKSYYNNSEEIL